MPFFENHGALFWMRLDEPGKIVIRVFQYLLELGCRSVISTMTSAVSVYLLERGRTARSAFKVPIPCDSESVCNIPLDPKLATQIQEADLIIWDKIEMCARYCIEAIELTLREIITHVQLLFSRKCILFSRDFR